MEGARGYSLARVVTAASVFIQPTRVIRRQAAAKFYLTSSPQPKTPGTLLSVSFSTHHDAFTAVIQCTGI